MIKLTKPATAPAILQEDDTSQMVLDCASYDSEPEEYKAGRKSFSFRASIYNCPEVKDALVAAQFSKCCFCESKVGHDGDVEHFRPKTASRQGVTMPTIRPGYYWLVYDWNNLMLSCSACNQRFKKNLFPLEDAAGRARTHHDDYALESPLFINPFDDIPETLISFRENIPYAVDDNKRAKSTIKCLKLNRPILNENRMEHLANVLILLEVLKSEHQLSLTSEGRTLLVRTRNRLREWTADSAPFASMVRVALAGYAQTLQ